MKKDDIIMSISVYERKIQENWIKGIMLGSLTSFILFILSSIFFQWWFE